MGRQRKLTPRAVRLLAAAARKTGMTARKLMQSTGVNASLRTLHRALSAHHYLEVGHLKPRPQLTPRHVALRFEWAKNVIGG